MRKISTLMAAATVVIMLSLAFTQVEAAVPKNTLVEATALDQVISLDPAVMFEIGASEIAGNTYQRLINYDLNDVSHVYGEVAKSWTVSKDGKTITFRIRKGLRFASGDPLTAADVVFSLQRAVILNKSPAFIIRQFGMTPKNVKNKIKQTGKYSFDFTMDKPYATSFALYCLTSTVASVVDKKLVMEHARGGDMGYHWLKTHYAGSGPFKIRIWKPNQAIVLDRNPNYSGKEPVMKRVIYRHIPEPTSELLLLKRGDVDVARKLESNELKNVAANPDTKIVKGTNSRIIYLGLNQNNKYLKNPKVREALKYLVPYRAIGSTIMKNVAEVHETAIPKGILGAIKDNPYSLNVEKAKKLLKEAGYPNGFSVTMDTRNSASITGIAQAIQQSFAKGGVKLQIIPGSGKQTLTKYRARRHDIYIGAWGSDYLDPNSNAQTFATNPNNADNSVNKTLAWRNAWNVPKDISSIVKKAVLERDADKRRKMYEVLQRKLLKDSPFIIMFQQVETMAARKDVKGLVIGPTSGADSVADVTKN